MRGKLLQKKMKTLKKISILIILNFTTLILQGKTTLISDGELRGSIVIPAKAIRVESYAAKELQLHIKKMTGIEVPILHDNNKLPEKNRIFLGAVNNTPINISDLPANGFKIEPKNSDLYIRGVDSKGAPLRSLTQAGTLFGVYDLLDKELGVKWLWPGEIGTVIPAHKNIIFDDNVKKTWKPQLINATYRTGKGKNGWASAKNCLNFRRDVWIWLRRHRMRLGRRMARGHAFTKYWKEFGKNKPELFSLTKDGKRSPIQTDRQGKYISMCVSNPELHDIIIKKWLKNPQMNINACENDTDGLCTCKRCILWDGPNPEVIKVKDPEVKGRFSPNARNVSERYAKFYNALYKKASKFVSNPTVFAYAYANYLMPPKLTKLNKNIIIGIVPATSNCPWDKEFKANFRKLWKGWQEAGASLYYRPNDTLTGHCFPLNYAKSLYKNLAFARKNSMIGTDFDSLNGQFGTQGLQIYTVARLHSNPTLSFDAILNEYCSSFGPAKNDIIKYFKLLEENTNRFNAEDMRLLTEKVGSNCSFRHWYLIAPYFFNNGTLAQGEKILEQASKKLNNNDEAEKRLKFLIAGLKNAQLTLEVQKYWTAFKTDPTSKNKLNYEKALKALNKFRGQTEAMYIADMTFLQNNEERRWDLSCLKISQDSFPLPVNWKFIFDPEQKGEKQNWYSPNYNDSNWGNSIVGQWEKLPVGINWKKRTGNDYDGIAWYRITFELDKKMQKAKQIKLCFGAVDESCDVWLNGKKIITRKFDINKNPNSWREPFSANVSKFIKRDDKNVLVVRVEDLSGAGGITQPVWLEKIPLLSCKNLIRDGSFESGNFDNWCSSAKLGDKVKIISDNTRTGKWACLVPAALPKGIRFAQKNIRVEKGKVYHFEIWIKPLAGFKGTVQVKMSTKRNAKSTKIRPVNKLWQKISGDFTAKSSNLYAAIWVKGKGKIIIDDITVNEKL